MQDKRLKAYEEGVPVNVHELRRTIILGECNLLVDGFRPTFTEVAEIDEALELKVFCDGEHVTHEFYARGMPRRERDGVAILIPIPDTDGEFVELTLSNPSPVVLGASSPSPAARDIQALLADDEAGTHRLTPEARTLLKVCLEHQAKIDQGLPSPRPTNQALLARLAEENRALMRENDRMRRAIQALPVDASNLNHVEVDRLIAELQASTATALRVQVAGNDRVWHRLHHTTALENGREVLDTLIACTIVEVDGRAFKTPFENIYVGRWLRRTDGGWHTQEVRMTYVAGIRIVTADGGVVPMQPPQVWEFDDMSAALLP